MERIIMRKKSKFAASAADSSSGTKSGGNSSKNPFSDLTNLNLIPTDVLRKLCSNSISTSDARPLLWKSQVPVFPIQQNSISSNADSKSPTSIGSSNTNTITTRQLPHFSSASSGDEDEDRELIPHGERQSAVNLEQQVKINSPSSSCNAVPKTNNKGKSVSMPLRSTRASEAKNKHKAVLGPLESTPLDKVIAKATRVLTPVSSTPVQKLKDKTSASAAPFKVNQSEKTRDEGKETTVSFGSIDKTKAKGKTVAMPWGSTSEPSEDNGSPTLLVTSSETHKRKESTIELEPVNVPQSYTSVQKVNGKPSVNVVLHEAIPGRTTDKGKATVVSFGSISYDKTKDKGKAVAMPWISLSEQSEDKGNSTVLVNCPETNKWKELTIEVGSSVVPEIYTPVQKVNSKTRANAFLHEVSPEKAKDKGKAAFVSFGSSSFYDKPKDKGKTVAMPWNSHSEQTDKRSPALVLGGRPQTNKRKISNGLDLSASSCPALQRKRNTWDDLYAANLVSSRGQTDPRPTRKKKKSMQKQTPSDKFLPEDFVKQQKAYFQEVDDFELEVEEAVGNGGDLLEEDEPDV